MGKETNERAFLEVMKQYRNSYQKIRRGEDGVWELPCKHGDIEPCSMTELSCFQTFTTAHGKEALKRKLPAYCTTIQECHTEIVFKFPIEHIHDIAGMLGARRRKKLSDEQRAEMSVRATRMNTARLNKITIRTADKTLKIEDQGFGHRRLPPDTNPRFERAELCACR